MTSPRRTVRLVREGFPKPPALDTAISRIILDAVAAGRRTETLRLHRPGPVVAFGPQDRLASGYAAAVGAARGRGFGAIQRLAGGRAAVFHEGTIAFSWAVPDPAPPEGITRRFEEIATIVAEAVRALGVDGRVGEVPGEYCPGAHSVNARGRTKLMGVGQRLVRGAAHVGGVVVVEGSDRVRDVLVEVYGALDLDWDPSTAGSLRDEVGAITWDAAAAALIDAFGARHELIPGELSPEEVRAAGRLEPSFRASG
jgi:lipoate-protein ligase A